MNPMKYAGAFAVAMVVMTAGSAPAQQPQPCAMMKDQQMGGMQQQGIPGIGMGMMKQDKDKEMSGMQGCMMMEDMKKQQQLMQEMKKHMKMMDEMMEMMMQRQQGMSMGGGMTPQGGGPAQQEHHPEQSR